MQSGTIPDSNMKSSQPDDMNEIIRRRQARRRNIQHSSSSKSDAGEFKIANTPLRVAAPPPKPLPLLTRFTPSCNLVETVFLDMDRPRNPSSLCSSVAEIVKKHGVKPLSIEVVTRFIPADEEEKILSETKMVTVLIMADWNERYPRDMLNSHPKILWEKIVIAAKKFVDKVKVSSTKLGDIEEIGIEMIDPSLVVSDRFCGPIPPPAMIPPDKCTTVYRKALDILDRYAATKNKVTFLCLMSYGPSADHKQNDLTLFVGLDYTSDSTNWWRPRACLKMMLVKVHQGIRLHMENNDSSSTDQCPFHMREEWDTKKIDEMPGNGQFDALRDKYHETVRLGDDIGPAHYLYIAGEDNNAADKQLKRFPGFGTLGCWVEVKTLLSEDDDDNDNDDNSEHGNYKYKWTKYALTSYSVIRACLNGFQLGKDAQGNAVPLSPSEGSELWKADINGIFPDSPAAAEVVPLESPTRRTHSWAIYSLETELRQVESYMYQGYENMKAEIQCELKNKRAFFDDNSQKNIFGTVYCASGYTRRTKQGGRLDWALIKPADTNEETRIGENELKTREEWIAASYSVDIQPNSPAKSPLADGSRALLSSSMHSKPERKRIDAIKNGDVVYNIGSSTGPTGGRFQQFAKVLVSVAEDRHVQEYITVTNANAETKTEGSERSYLSTEYIFYGMGMGREGSRVAKRGDSGSVAFDADGNALGLVFGAGQANFATNGGHAFITPIEDVFEDIKAYSNHKIVDIRIVKG